MTAVDNLEIVAKFCPVLSDEQWNGDRSLLSLFVYTELLDRGRRKGNNSARIVRTFYHRCEQELREQMPSIRKLCDATGARACTRLAPRSYERVGALHTTMVVEAALTRNWSGMKSLYARACGTVKLERKLWLFDVDAVTPKTDEFAKQLEADSHLRARVPSKKGEHLITVPFDMQSYVGRRVESGWSAWGEVTLHKDNPTNLYIPEGAA